MISLSGIERGFNKKKVKYRLVFFLILILFRAQLKKEFAIFATQLGNKKGRRDASDD